MPNPAEQLKTIDRLVEYLIRQPESTARRMAADLGIDKTSINSVLYANAETFVSMGDKPPLWSVRSAVEPAHSDQSSNDSKRLSAFLAESVDMKKTSLTAAGRPIDLVEEIPSIRNINTETGGSIISEKYSALEPSIVKEEDSAFRALVPRHEVDDKDIPQAPVPTERYVDFLESQETQKVEDEPEEFFDELKYEIEYLVRNFPGIRLDELELMLDVDPGLISSRLRDVRYLVITDENKSSEYSDSELKFLDDITKAATLAFPLSSDEYDNLVRRGFVKGVSSVRIGQVFGSWRAACELAGVEAPTPWRQSYERRWTERELAEAVARYLSEPEFRGAHHRYDEWRKRNLNTDEIPSSGTLKNYLGRSWTTVRNRGLEILRERWLSIQEIDNNG